jgi:hypothetical protein
MLNKSLSIIILVSMILHCSSRLGVLSYLYENRHDIAYRVGLVAEIPIAICESNYNFSKGLIVQHNNVDDEAPASLTTAHEINLFFQFNASDLLSKCKFVNSATAPAPYMQRIYHSPFIKKFQPPKVS